MDVKAKRYKKSERHNRQSGQSMLEFAFLAPLIVVFLTIMVQVNTAIQVSIVNQKYARQHLHFLMFHSRYYPEHSPFLERANGTYMRRYWVGVTDAIGGAGGKIEAIAPKIKVGRQKVAEDDSSGTAQQRQNVRIRVSAFTCIPPLGIEVGRIFSEGNLGEETFLAGNYPYCED